MIFEEEINIAGNYIKSRRPTRLSLELLARANKSESLPKEIKEQESTQHKSTQHKSEKSELK